MLDFSQLVTERHWTPEQLGELWGLSADSIQRLFEREPGVLVIERARSSRRRTHFADPKSVAERVHAQTEPSPRSETLLSIYTVRCI